MFGHTFDEIPELKKALSENKLTLALNLVPDVNIENEEQKYFALINQIQLVLVDFYRNADLKALATIVEFITKSDKLYYLAYHPCPQFIDLISNCIAIIAEMDKNKDRENKLKNLLKKLPLNDYSVINHGNLNYNLACYYALNDDVKPMMEYVLRARFSFNTGKFIADKSFKKYNNEDFFLTPLKSITKTSTQWWSSLWPIKEWYETQTLSIQLLETASKKRYTKDDYLLIEELLKKGVSPNFTTPSPYHNDSPFSKVISSSCTTYKTDLIKLMLHYGADLNTKNIYYPVALAARKGDFNLVQLMVQHGATKGFNDGLRIALKSDNIDLIKYFVSLGVNINHNESSNESFLLYCNEPYHLRDNKTTYQVLPGIEAAKYLLSKGANPNGLKTARSNPLENALAHDFVEFAELLINHGANLKPNQDSTHPILSYTYSIKMAKLLIAHGANINQQSQKGYTPLISAIDRRDKKQIEFYIKNGAHLYATDQNNETAFHRAIGDENIKFLEYLLQFYDVKKCHDIKSVFSNNLKTETITFLQNLLGLENLEKELQVTFKTEHLFEADLNKIKNTYTTLIKTNNKLKPFLISPEKALSPKILKPLHKELKINFKAFNGQLKTTIQALYFEYSGDVTLPFGTDAMFWAYTTCAKDLKLNGCVMGESGHLDLYPFFKNMEGLNEGFEAQCYDDAKNYLKTIVTLSLNVVFKTIMEEENIPFIGKPFYFIGNEHDDSPKIIYEIKQ